MYAIILYNYLEMSFPRVVKTLLKGLAMLYFTKGYVLRLLQRLVLRLESVSEYDSDDDRVTTEQGLKICRELEEIGRSEHLPMYVVTHFEDDHRVYTHICQLLAIDRDIPGGRFIDFGQVFDVSDLDLSPERERYILALLNRKHPAQDDPTGDIQYYIEAVEEVLVNLKLDRYPDRRSNQIVQMLREIRAELYNSDSPGVVTVYLKAVGDILD